MFDDAVRYKDLEMDLWSAFFVHENWKPLINCHLRNIAGIKRCAGIKNFNLIDDKPGHLTRLIHRHVYMGRSWMHTQFNTVMANIKVNINMPSLHRGQYIESKSPYRKSILHSSAHRIADICDILSGAAAVSHTTIIRFCKVIVPWLWCLACVSTGALLRRQPNFKAIRYFKLPISRLQEFTRSYDIAS